MGIEVIAQEGLIAGVVEGAVVLQPALPGIDLAVLLGASGALVVETGEARAKFSNECLSHPIKASLCLCPLVIHCKLLPAPADDTTILIPC